MVLFDAAKREVCEARRQVTSTPLQALVLWNDPQYVEAARALAQRTMTQVNKGLDEQLTAMFRSLTSRIPDAEELAILRTLHDEQRAFFEASPEDSEKFLSIGDCQRDEQLDVVELAALSAVAAALLSYDETITKR